MGTGRPDGHGSDRLKALPRLRDMVGLDRRDIDLMAETYGWFTEGFETADLKDAKALLEEL